VKDDENKVKPLDKVECYLPLRITEKVVKRYAEVFFFFFIRLRLHNTRGAARIFADGKVLLRHFNDVILMTSPK